MNTHSELQEVFQDVPTIDFTELVSNPPHGLLCSTEDYELPKITVPAGTVAVASGTGYDGTTEYILRTPDNTFYTVTETYDQLTEISSDNEGFFSGEPETTIDVYDDLGSEYLYTMKLDPINYILYRVSGQTQLEDHTLTFFTEEEAAKYPH